MLLTNYRFSPTPDNSLAAFSIDGVFQCFVLEPSLQQRIPGGIYKVTLRTEGELHKIWGDIFPQFHIGMLWIRNVPNREYLLIHPGNYVHQTDGCLLTGETCSNNTLGTAKVQNSRAAYSRIYKQIAPALSQGEDVKIIIGDIVELMQFNQFNTKEEHDA